VSFDRRRRKIFIGDEDSLRKALDFCLAIVRGVRVRYKFLRLSRQ